MQSQSNSSNLNVQYNQTLDDQKANGRIICRNHIRDVYTQHICKDRIEILLDKIDNCTVQEVTAELNEILLDPAIGMKKNGVKKIHNLKCYNHVTRKIKQAYHKAKNRNNKLKTKESMVDLKIKQSIQKILYRAKLQKEQKRCSKIIMIIKN